jgi:hypothetical protein
MDPQQAHARGRSPSAPSPAAGGGAHIRNSHSPSPARFGNQTDPSSSSIGLGLGLEPQQQQQFSGQTDFFLNEQQEQQSSAPFSQSNLNDPSFVDQDYVSQTQADYSQGLLAQNFGDADFTIFPPTPGEQFNTPLFAADKQQLADTDDSMIAASHSTTPPHLLSPDPQSTNHSPSFGQHQFSSHSRHASLAPEAALLSGQVEWPQTGPQFHGHRRSASEYSDVSSAAPSPRFVSADTFDPIEQSHSPMQRPADIGVFNELHGISSFSISDQGTHSPNHHVGRSPSHSPAISPRILPQQGPDMSAQTSYLLQAHNSSYGPPPSYAMQGSEAFPTLPGTGPEVQMAMQAPPAIEIDFAPPAIKHGFEPGKSLDADSLTPPERGTYTPSSAALLFVFSDTW